MNYKPDPRAEYKMLEDFYTNGESEEMPAGLQMIERIYQEAWQHLKLGFLPYKKIANLLRGKFPELGLSSRNALNHVCNAAQYYAQSKIESKDLHRRRLTDMLYKQIELIQQTVARHKPLEAAKEIRAVSAEIAKLTGAYEPELIEDQEPQEIVFLLHDDAKKVPGIKAISEGKLIREIEGMAKQYELDEAEKEKIINEDVLGGLPARK